MRAELASRDRNDLVAAPSPETQGARRDSAVRGPHSAGGGSAQIVSPNATQHPSRREARRMLRPLQCRSGGATLPENLPTTRPLA